jgi:2-phosphosulfolactate phosphatase
MRVDVFLTPLEVTPADVVNRAVAVIDVLRASTTIATAIANGARAVVPLANSEEVVSRAASLGKGAAKLAGERKSLPIPGFDLGNSPLQFTPDVVDGQTILMTTTNGTAAILAVQGARDVIIASYVNFTAVLTMLRVALRGGSDVAIVCAGHERRFALEDAACAGLFVRHLAATDPPPDINDAAHAAMLIDRKFGKSLKKLVQTSQHGAALAEAGFGADLAACIKVDSVPVLPVYQDRQVTKVGTERAR